MSGAVTDANLRLLLENALYLTSKIALGNDTANAAIIESKRNDTNVKKVKLQDLKDAISTYNREFVERESELAQNGPKNMFSTLQDWSLFILFSSYAVFSLSILIYIFRFSTAPVILGIGFMILSTLLYTLFVFMIQRFG